MSHRAGVTPQRVPSPEPYLLPVGESAQKMKSKGERKSRFFVCFWPDADTTDPPAGKADSVLALIAMPEKELIPVIVETKAKQNMRAPLPDSDSCSMKKLRRFQGLKKAIFSNTKGRICDGKVRHDPRRSLESAETIIVEPVPPVKQRKPGRSIILKTDSNCVSPSSSLSPSTSSSALSRSKKSNFFSRRKTDFSTVTSEPRHGKHSSSPRPQSRKAPIPDGKKGTEPTLDPIIGLLCFLAFSLSATVIWGRVYAVFFTLILSCFLGLTRELRSPESSRRPECPATPPKPDSSEYRKRVIMEGILVRSHRHKAPGPAG